MGDRQQSAISPDRPTEDECWEAFWRSITRLYMSLPPVEPEQTAERPE